jgi:hypothetical protein
MSETPIDLFGHPALERRASDGLTRADGGSDDAAALAAAPLPGRYVPLTPVPSAASAGTDREEERRG